MCPFCFGTLGLIVAGTVSTGGLAVLAAKVSRKKSNAAEATSKMNARSKDNDYTHSR
jgi:hypothetical protein